MALHLGYVFIQVYSFIFLFRYEQAEFVEREMEHMTEQIKTIIDALNTSQVSVLLATQNFFQRHTTEWIELTILPYVRVENWRQQMG